MVKEKWVLDNGPPGDLYVMMHVKNHKIFQRDGANIYHEKPISFVQASLGDSVEVPTLEKPVELKIPAGTQSGTTFRLKGQGMPHLRWNGKGNLYVKGKSSYSSKIKLQTKRTPPAVR